ncbi:hypothetical protein [Pseudoflavonifractor sp. 524-17]|uniref:hypothetical protein n=1 Tax=Pseudoflavonifractor sp. 524-17 TaxID=2304577 RepID=UPI001379D6BA|nr:hypothetical protein [Pseudoflavonifractor sp. 524-17]
MIWASSFGLPRPRLTSSVLFFSLSGLLSKTKNADTTRPPPAKTLWFGLCICVKNMCSIQLSTMVSQTDVPVNALGKILSRAGASYGDALCGKLGVCIYKRSKPRFPAMPETVVLLVGKYPKPFEQTLRWSGYGSASLTDFENAVSCHGTVCDYAGKPASPFSKNLRQGREKKCRNGA